ncbi:RNA polymerase sigma factor [Tunturiibacter gelidiferens]|uniref:RNA polymerase sigma factor n=1 Tax=Tunturiibacter gelidiferens TaxID=3069689 RepID=UPI003D9BBC4A
MSIGSTSGRTSLLVTAKSGHHSALWARHSNKAFKVVYRIIGNRNDAEDTLQDAWMKAFIHLKTFDARSKFST